MDTSDALLRQALSHHQAGRIREAEQLYRRVLELNSDQPEAVIRLALLCMSGRSAESEQLLRRALEIHPSSIELLNTLGIVLCVAGRIGDAIPVFQHALAVRPTPESHFNLAKALHANGQLEPALVQFKQALALRPDHLETMLRQAQVLRELHRVDDALVLLQNAATLAPHVPQVFFSLSTLLFAEKQPAAARAAAERALKIKPDYGDAWLALADALLGQKNFHQAIEAYRRAFALRSENAAAHRWLGVALFEVDRLDESILEFNRSLEMAPTDADARWDYALALLKAGHFQRAWPEYESRHHKKVPNTPRQIGKPRWDGRPLNGRWIYLQGEQAFGDRIQFIRFASLVARAGGRVIVETLPELRRLFASVPGVERVTGEQEPVPEADWQCPVLSLPGVFNISVDTIPGKPYLFPSDAWIGPWRERLSQHRGKPCIGLVWAGRPEPDPLRSIPLEMLTPILQLENIQLVSLQTGLPADQLSRHPLASRVIRIDRPFVDFADTAALMCCLDGVITIDTASAHLAGALGVPVWLLLKHHSDYRWMTDRADSPWYPTMKLVRQPKPGDWPATVQQLKTLVERITANPR